MAIKIVFGKRYLKETKSLTDDERFLLDQLVNRIKYDRIAPGDNREVIKCQSGENVFSFRINNDMRLAAYLWKPKEYLLIACGHHDDLYRRVSRMKMSCLGKAELPAPIEPVVDVNVVDVDGTEARPEFINGLCRLTTSQLVEIGVSEAIASDLISAKTEDAVIAIVQDLDSHILRDVVLDIACDTLSYENARTKVVMPGTPRTSVETVLKRNWSDRENYYILDDDKLELYLNGQLEDWQVFLHPDQTRGVEMESNGPMMVTGPAGTGKSVVAVHRVKWLLTHPYKVKGRVLLTTFTHTLAEYARKLLKTICTEEEMSRVEVMHFDQYFQSLLSRHLPRARIIYGDVDFRKQTSYTRLLESVCRIHDICGRTPGFIASEYDRVIAENNINSLDEYKAVVRPRDMKRLNVETREKLWPAFRNLIERARGERGLPRAVLLNKLTEILSPRDCVFDSIVVDEAQDLGAPEYRLLAKLTGNSSRCSIPYSLFFAGDGHQRIYNRTGSLMQCGINVKGRSIHLVKCYRSTKKIREYAEKIIAGVTVKDMDEEVDNLVGSESLAEGVPPEVRFCTSEVNKLDVMANSISQWIASGVNPGDCAILVRRNSMRDRIAAGLNAKGISVDCINRVAVDFDSAHVKVMTMHRAKGLQFMNVIVDLDGWPQKGVSQADDDEVSAQLLVQEKCLLYMSVMRAQANVLITNSTGVNTHIPSSEALL